VGQLGDIPTAEQEGDIPGKEEQRTPLANADRFSAGHLAPRARHGPRWLICDVYSLAVPEARERGIHVTMRVFVRCPGATQGVVGIQAMEGW
jgi:hypothetical protein